MIVDLHNHTKLCNHAIGEIEQYVLKAKEAGTKIYGFSDHAPMNFDEKYRMPFEKMDSYELAIKEIAEKFKDSLDVRLGYEVDWLEGLLDERVLNRNVDYLIGSVHFLNSWGFDNAEFIGSWNNKDVDLVFENYFSAIEAMAKSSLFDIVGHLDLIKIFNFKPKKDIRILAKNALKAIKESNMAVELNSAGWRKPCKELYPSDELLYEIANLGICITLGSDAHSVEHIDLNGEKTLAKAHEFKYSEVVAFKGRDKEFIKI